MIRPKVNYTMRQSIKSQIKIQGRPCHPVIALNKRIYITHPVQSVGTYPSFNTFMCFYWQDKIAGAAIQTLHSFKQSGWATTDRCMILTQSDDLKLRSDDTIMCCSLMFEVAQLWNDLHCIAGKHTFPSILMVIQKYINIMSLQIFIENVYFSH